jgi:hypothetical protein
LGRCAEATAGFASPPGRRPHREDFLSEVESSVWFPPLRDFKDQIVGVYVLLVPNPRVGPKGSEDIRVRGALLGLPCGVHVGIQGSRRI